MSNGQNLAVFGLFLDLLYFDAVPWQAPLVPFQATTACTADGQGYFTCALILETRDLHEILERERRLKACQHTVYTFRGKADK